MKQRVKRPDVKFRIYHPFETNNLQGQNQFPNYQQQQQYAQQIDEQQSFGRKILNGITKGLGNVIGYFFNKPKPHENIMIYHQTYGTVQYVNYEQSYPIKRKVAQGVVLEEQNQGSFNKQVVSPQIASGHQSKKRILDIKQNSPKRLNKQGAQKPPSQQNLIRSNKNQKQIAQSPVDKNANQIPKKQNEQVKKENPQVNKIFDNKKTNLDKQANSKENKPFEPKKKIMISAGIQTDILQSASRQTSDSVILQENQKQKEKEQKNDNAQLKKQEDQILNKIQPSDKTFSVQNQVSQNLFLPLNQQPQHFNPVQKTQENSSKPIEIKQQPPFQTQNTSQNFKTTTQFQFGKDDKQKSNLTTQENKPLQENKKPDEAVLVKQKQEQQAPQQKTITNQPLFQSNFQFPAQAVEIPFEDEGFASDSQEGSDIDSDKEEENKQQPQDQLQQAIKFQPFQNTLQLGQQNIFAIPQKINEPLQAAQIFGQQVTKEQNSSKRDSTKQNIAPQENVQLAQPKQNAFPVFQQKDEKQNQDLNPFDQTQNQSLSLQKIPTSTVEPPKGDENKQVFDPLKQDPTKVQDQKQGLPNNITSVNPSQNQIANQTSAPSMNPFTNAISNPQNSISLPFGKTENNQTSNIGNNAATNQINNPFTTNQTLQPLDKAGNPFLASANQVQAPVFRFGEQKVVQQNVAELKQPNLQQENLQERPKTPMEISMTPNNQIFTENINPPQIRNQVSLNQNQNPFQAIDQKQQNIQQNQNKQQIPFQNQPEQTFGQTFPTQFGQIKTQINLENPLRPQQNQLPFNQSQQNPFQNTLTTTFPLNPQLNQLQNISQNQLPQTQTQIGSIPIQQQPFFVGNKDDENQPEGQRVIHRARRPGKK